MGRAVKPINTRNRVPVGASKPRPPKNPIDKAKAYEVVWQQVSGIFEAARPWQGISYVYFIGEEDGPIKIGVSTDPIARLRGMQTGNPRRLRIEYVLVGDRDMEQLLHELWESYAIKSAAAAGKPNSAPGTEWFEHEARAEMLPIIRAAAGRQVQRLQNVMKDATAAEMEKIVRKVHAQHGHEAKLRDKPKLLGATVGYVVVGGRSRI